MRSAYKYICFAVACLVCACKVPYTPAPISANNNYLVVEGIINISDSTFINLSRTTTIMSANTTKPELKAVITIESNTGSSYSLKEKGAGVYAAPNYNLSPANQYRLRIKTADNNTYASDFGVTKVTPPIDSMVRDFEGDGLYISVRAHDATGNTRYYRWDFTETWQFTSFFESHLTAEGVYTNPAAYSPIFIGSPVSVVPRTNDIYHCWGNNFSHLITLNSTAGLSSDIINVQPITYVASSSEKLSIRYRINIRQYALTKDAYDFWTLLQKNTENLGSIFDAQPSATVGNIHNVNKPAEPVIGYISTSSVSQQTVYINYTDLPKSYVANYLNNTPYNKNTCALGPFAANPYAGNVPNELDFFIRSYPHSIYLPVDVIMPFNPAALTGAVSGSTAACVDCTLRGSNVKPAFWQ